MFSFISKSRIRRFFVFRQGMEDSRIVAAKMARRCLGNVVGGLDRDCANWSVDQLRGYLRAIAAPCMDRALVELSLQRAVRGEWLSAVKNYAMEMLEQLVLQEIRKPLSKSSKKAVAA